LSAAGVVNATGEVGGRVVEEAAVVAGLVALVAAGVVVEPVPQDASTRISEETIPEMKSTHFLFTGSLLLDYIICE